MPPFYEYGLTPDTPEELAEIRRGQVSFESYSGGDWLREHGPYPQARYQVPPDISWSSFHPELLRRKAYFDTLRNAGWCLWWWELARAFKLPMQQVLQANQLQFTTCAGFVAAVAWMRKVIYQKLTAPVAWEWINPMPMWAITKGYNIAGGQSMAAVKLGAARYGNYAVTDPGIGEYPGTVNRAVYEKAAPLAQERQLCSCMMPNTLEALQLCLDALEVVAIGNRAACRTARLDGNNILIGVISGAWSHAHAYDAIRYVRGVPYFHWSNEWGGIYKGSKENEPEIGCWHTPDQARQMLEGASCWTTVYAEAKCNLVIGSTPFTAPFVGYPDYVLHTHS